MAEEDDRSNQEVVSAEPTEVIEQLEKLPRDKQEIVLQTIFAKFHRGPLPAPEDLEAYERLIHNGADRIMQMAEKEQAHRHTREDENDRAETKLQSQGQTIGTAIVFALLLLATAFVFTGHEAPAITIFSVTILGLGSIFVLRRHGGPKD